jgi:DNA transformation protein
MPVGDSFRVYALEQLGRVVHGGVRARRMFGAVGLYDGDRFFGIIDDDVVYLRADDRTAPLFEAEGLARFRPLGEGHRPMKYYGLPTEWLEEPVVLALWVARALEAAAGGGRKGRRD